jgi:hypothetical protein
VAVGAAAAALVRAHDADGAALVEPQELGEPELEPAAMRLATVSVGLVSPRST